MVSDLNHLTSKDSVNQQSYATKDSFTTVLPFLACAAEQVESESELANFNEHLGIIPH